VSTPITLAWMDAAGILQFREFDATGLTAAQMVRQVGIVPVDAPLPVMGVFSQKIADPETYTLSAGERLEIYQPLTLNPMEVRRLRAQRHPVGRRKPRP